MQKDAIGISLDLINRHYQEPNRNRYESRYFWEELYGLIAAAGFSAIEIPYEPVWQFGGRSGVPMTRYSINTKYESAARYRAMLADKGIARVSGVSFDPNLFMRNGSLDFFFGAGGHFAGEALSHAADLGAEYFAISPSAYYGRTLHYHPDLESQMENFTERTITWLGGLATKAADLGVAMVLRHEYWSLFGGERLTPLLAALPDTVKLDVDTANLYIAGIDAKNFIARQAGRIGCVHLTDTNLVDTTELWKTANPEFPPDKATQVFRDPGTGLVDLQGIASLLSQLDYQGSVTISARQTRDPFRALLRMRAMITQLPI